MRTPIRVLLIDDHPAILGVLADLIDGARDLEVCGKSNSFEEAREALAISAPDVVVMDISLGDGNGLDLLADFGSIRPSAPIVIFSMHDGPSYVGRAKAAGAAAFVAKSQPTADLLAAIRSAAVPSPPMASAGL